MNALHLLTDSEVVELLNRAREAGDVEALSELADEAGRRCA